jgi:hypothetical protein
MEKVNPFIRIKQYKYTDHELDENGEIKLFGNFMWWIDEDDLEDFKEVHADGFESGEIKLIEERVIKGVDYNNWLIGNVYGDYEGKYVDETCPKCGHLLVLPDLIDHDRDPRPSGDERFCSNNECDHTNAEYDNYLAEDEKFWEELASKPEVKIKEPGQTLEEFNEKYGMEAPVEMECIKCKRIVPAKEWYRNKGYAVVSYKHENCSNQGPSMAVPLGKEAEKWANLLG